MSTCSTRTLFKSGSLARRILSDHCPLPTSNILAHEPLFVDFHQLEKVRPAVPVVKVLMLIYWLLEAESDSWLLDTAAPFWSVAS